MSTRSLDMSEPQSRMRRPGLRLWMRMAIRDDPTR